MQTRRPADSYSPIYFLSSVGAGGLAVTFFMYLLFWVPHPGRSVPNFEDISAALATGNLPQQAGIAIAMIGIALFAAMNIQKLAWNIGAFTRFKRTEAYDKLRASNAETTLLAYPLALAMTVNALFIVGLVFVPNLWSVVEILFPFAMAAFLAIGIFALTIIGDFLGRVLVNGGLFDVTAHNSFAQMLPTFALSMIAVGLSAPAAMSTNGLVVGVSMIGSTFFATVAIVYGVVALVTAFNSMLHYGTAKESAPTLMILVPIVTTLGIMFLRQSHGMHTTYQGHTTDGETMVFLARLLSLQVAFLLLGLVVLKREGYWSDFVFGSKTSPGSYALVCPGVALSVMIQFFLHKGLVATGLVTKFGVAYWSVEGVALAFQAAMILLVLRLNRQHFAKADEPAAVPAE